MMHNAIAKCGVLKKKSGMLRRKESRFYVLTNTGGFFFAKGFAAEFESLKPLLTLTGSSEVSLGRGGSADSGYVMRITTRGNKPQPLELEASSEPDTVAWSQVVHDVIELVGTINGDQYAAQPRPLGGLRVGDEGWYLEPTGRMALYTLNSHRRWAVQDRREYDEPTVLNWIAGDRVSRTSSSGSNSARLGYPSQSGAAVAGSSADQGSGSPDYPVNSGRGSPDPAPPAHPADYPSQHSHSQSMRSTSATMSHLGGGSGGGSGGGGGGGGTWATHAPPAGPNSSFAHGGGGGSGSPEAGGTVVGGVLVRGGRGGGGDGGGGGGGSADAILVGPLPVLPSVFVVGKGEGNSFGDEADSLVLRRPSTSCSANGGGGGGGSADGGRGRREEQAGEEVVAVTANNNSHGRLGRVGRWRGGGRGAGAAAAAPERRQSGGDSGRRPPELSPGMEVLQSWLQRS